MKQYRKMAPMLKAWENRLSVTATWTERELEALCLGAAPESYGDRDEIAPAAERERVRRLISAAIENGQLIAEPSTSAASDDFQRKAAKLYGSAWAINRISAIRWGMGFEKFPKKLIQPDLKGIYKRQEIEKRAEGRYTLAEATHELCSVVGERQENILPKLLDAARRGKLKTFGPGQHSKYSYPRTTKIKEFYEEVYWNDLNIWLEVNEPRISFRYSCPPGVEQGNPEKKKKTGMQIRDDAIRDRRKQLGDAGCRNYLKEIKNSVSGAANLSDSRLRRIANGHK